MSSAKLVLKKNVRGSFYVPLIMARPLAGKGIVRPWRYLKRGAELSAIAVEQASPVGHDKRRVSAIVPLPRHHSPFASHNPTIWPEDPPVSGLPSWNSIWRSCGEAL